MYRPEQLKPLNPAYRQAGRQRSYLNLFNLLNLLSNYFDPALEKKKSTTIIPAAFKSMLIKNKKAFEKYSSMPPSHQKEYINYITEAKKEETQIRRAEKVLEMLSNK